LENDFEDDDDDDNNNNNNLPRVCHDAIWMMGNATSSLKIDIR
jgi:hypothetical protein